jgi:hypothetical protein
MVAISTFIQLVECEMVVTFNFYSTLFQLVEFEMVVSFNFISTNLRIVQCGIQPVKKVGCCDVLMTKP